MGLFDRFRRPARGGAGSGGDAQYLAEWVRTHVGVEAYVEPKTTVTDVTVMLVAADGEWTRRIVGERGAQRISRELKIPVYDASRVGYPQRMRDYDARQRAQRRERDLG